MKLILLFLPSIFLLVNGIPLTTTVAPAQEHSENYLVSINANKKIGQLASGKSISLFGSSFPDSGRKQPVLEHEDSLLSKFDTTYGRAQEFAASFYHPKPIVDSLSEEEKYGNDGEKYRNVGKAVVGTFEGFFNFLNAAAEFPFEAATKFGKQVTTSLNKVGGKLVGLAYKSE